MGFTLQAILAAILILNVKGATIDKQLDKWIDNQIDNYEEYNRKQSDLQDSHPFSPEKNNQTRLCEDGNWTSWTPSHCDESSCTQRQNRVCVIDEEPQYNEDRFDPCFEGECKDANQDRPSSNYNENGTYDGDESDYDEDNSNYDDDDSNYNEDYTSDEYDSDYDKDDSNNNEDDIYDENDVYDDDDDDEDDSKFYKDDVYDENESNYDNDDSNYDEDDRYKEDRSNYKDDEDNTYDENDSNYDEYESNYNEQGLYEGDESDYDEDDAIRQEEITEMGDNYQKHRSQSKFIKGKNAGNSNEPEIEFEEIVNLKVDTDFNKASNTNPIQVSLLVLSAAIGILMFIVVLMLYKKWHRNQNAQRKKIPKVSSPIIKKSFYEKLPISDKELSEVVTDKEKLITANNENYEETKE